MKDRIGFGATEGHSESSFWICFKKSFASSHSGSNVVTYMFKVQNRRTEAARNIEWSSKGNSFKHCTPSVFPCRAKGLPFPRSLTWFPFPTGNTNIPHGLFVFINKYYRDIFLLRIWIIILIHVSDIITQHAHLGQQLNNHLTYFNDVREIELYMDKDPKTWLNNCTNINRYVHLGYI